MNQKNPQAIAPHFGNGADRVIGAAIAARRSELGMSRKHLAQALGVSEDQITRFERGAARVPASALMHLSHVLETSVRALLPGHGVIPAATGYSSGEYPLINEIIHAALVLDVEGRTRLLAAARALQPQHSAHKRQQKS